MGRTTRISVNHVLIRESSVSPPRIKHVWSVLFNYLNAFSIAQAHICEMLNVKSETDRTYFKKFIENIFCYLSFWKNQFLKRLFWIIEIQMILLANFLFVLWSFNLVYYWEQRPLVHLLFLDWFSQLSGSVCLSVAELIFSVWQSTDIVFWQIDSCINLVCR